MTEHNWQRTGLWRGFDCIRSILPRLGRNKCRGCGAQISDYDLFVSRLPTEPIGHQRISLDVIAMKQAA